jgi:hypothetical protein
MTAAASDLARAPLYGIGSCRVGRDTCDFEIGWDDFDRDITWAETTLRAAGIAAGDMVLVTSPNWEGPWTSPVVHALRRIKAVYATAEQFDWDARRVKTFLDRLPIKAIIGLGVETLEGLRSLGADPAELLSGVNTLWTRYEALPKVRELGLAATPFVLLGPALAMGVVPGREALVNNAEWTVTSRAGELHVTTASRRATRFAALATGIEGQVGATSDHGTVIAFSAQGGF